MSTSPVYQCTSPYGSSLELQKNALCQQYGKLLARGKEMKVTFARSGKLLERQERDEIVGECLKSRLPDEELEHAQMVRAAEPTPNNRTNFADTTGTLTDNLRDSISEQASLIDNMKRNIQTAAAIPANKKRIQRKMWRELTEIQDIKRRKNEVLAKVQQLMDEHEERPDTPSSGKASSASSSDSD